VRTLLRPLAVLLAAVLLAACGDSGSATGNRAATVNGTDISRSLVERIVDAQLSGEGAPTGDELTAATGEVQRNVLSTLISIEIVRGMAEDEGIEVTEDDLDEAYADQVALYEEQAPMSGQDPDFAAFLETIGLTEEEYRELIVADVARREALTEMFSEPVDDEQVQALYDEQSEPQIDARHILVETEDEAQDAVDRIEGGEDFAEVAADVSLDGSAEDGGNLGVAPASQYVPEFADAISNGEVNELLGPVETDFGFHVIEVLGVEDPPPFEEVEEQLRAQLEQQSQQDPELIALYEEAFTSADVSVAAGLGEWDAEQGRVIDPDAEVGTGDAPVDGGAPAPGGDPAEGEMPTEEELQEMLDELEQGEQPAEDGAPDEQ
jgi:parvulin-like peptidyl-prolyl isomerase